METNIVTSQEQEEGIQVCVRVRPLNDREKLHESEHGNSLSWKIDNNNIVQCINGKPTLSGSGSFSFDHIFNQSSQNEQIFDTIAMPMVKSTIAGFNATIFAYGQTSSGKTHTMLGVVSDPGITPRSIQSIFELIASETHRQFLLRCSFIEIYNENIRDLLSPENDNLKVHEDITGRVFVEASQQPVTCAEEILAAMNHGEQNRTFGATNMNERSSRSHTIFTVYIESRERPSGNRAADDALDQDGQLLPPHEEDQGLSVRASALNLVDLAGSERVSLTGAEGIRLKEGAHINKSLLTLGTVINKLSEGSIRHIPYRDSKLTRILQSALGGNSRTAIICAVTPAGMHSEETISTLKFASRAKNVKNRTSCNEILDDRAMMLKYKKELEKLKAQLESGQLVLSTANPSASSRASDVHSRASLNPSRLSSIPGSEQRMAPSSAAAAAAAAAGASNKQVASLKATIEDLETRLASESVKVTELDKKLQNVNHGIFEKILAATEAEDPDAQPVRKRVRRDSCPVYASTIDDAGAQSKIQDLQVLREKLQTREEQLMVAEKMRYNACIQFEALKTEVDHLEQTAESAQTELQQARRDLESTYEEAQKYESQLEVLRVDFDAQAQILQATKLQVNGLQSELEQSNDCLRIAEARITGLEANFKDATANYQEQLQRVTFTTQVLEKKELELRQLEKEHKAGNGPLMKEVTRLTSKLSDTEAKLKLAHQANAKWTAEKSHMEQELKNIQKELRSVEALRVKSDASNTKIKESQLAAAANEKRANATEKELEQVRIVLQEIEHEKKELLGRLDDRESVIANLSRDIQETKQHMEAFHSELDAVKAEKEGLDSQLKHLSSIYKAETDKVECLQARVKDIESLHREAADAAQASRQALELKLNDTEAANQQLAKERDDLCTQLTDLHIIVGELQATKDIQTTIIESEKNRCSDFQEQSKSLLKRCQEVELELEQTRTQKDETEIVVQDQRAQVAALKLELGMVQQQKQDIEDLLDRAKSDLGSEQIRTQELGQALTENSSVIAQLECRAQELSEKYNLLENQAKDTEQSHAAECEAILLVQRNAERDYAIELGSLQTQLQDTQARLQATVSSLVQTQQTADAVRQALESQIKQLELSRAEMIQEHHNFQSEYASKLEAMQAQLENSQTELHDMESNMLQTRQQYEEERQSLQYRITQLEQLVFSLESEKQQLQEEVDSRTSQLSDQVLQTQSQMQARVNSLILEKEQLVKEHESANILWQARRRELEADSHHRIHELKSQISSMESTLSMLEAEKIQQQGENLAHSSQLGDQWQHLQVQWKVAMDNLQEQIDVLKSDKEHLHQERAALEFSWQQRMRESEAEWRERIVELERQISSMEGQAFHGVTEQASLVKQFAVKHEMANSQTEQPVIVHINKENVRLPSEPSDKVEQRLAKALRETNMLLEEKTRMMEVLMKRDQRIEELEEKLEQILSHVGKYGKLAAKIERRDDEIKRWKAEVSSLEQLLVAHNKGEQVLQIRNETSMQAQLDYIQKMLDNTIKEKAKMLEERDQLRRETSTLRNLIKQRDIHQLQLQKQLRETKIEALGKPQL